MLRLDESLFDDIIAIPVYDMMPNIADTDVTVDEITPDNADAGVEIGISNEIAELIKNKYDSIQKYNDFISNINTYGYSQFEEVVKTMINDEMSHIGQLQELMQQVSPNAAIVQQGEVEVENVLGEALTESYDDIIINDIEYHSVIEESYDDDFEDPDEKLVESWKLRNPDFEKMPVAKQQAETNIPNQIDTSLQMNIDLYDDEF